MTKFFITLISVIIMSIPAFGTAFANSTGDTVKITRENQTIDLMKLSGVTVRAVYHPISELSDSVIFSDEVYCCAALVSRFYKKVYRIDITGLYPGSVPYADGRKMRKALIPSVGDIYGSLNHWAIVKEVEGFTVTLFEQNWCWSDGGVTYAKRNRTVNLLDLDSGECFYTVRGKEKTSIKLRGKA